MLLRLQNSADSMTNMIRQQERTANNLANINTVGYRAERSFIETLDEFIDYENSPQSVRQIHNWAEQSQGQLEATGNALDFAITGDGYFAVVDGDGTERYTRAGRFMLDEDFTLRDPNGSSVQGQDGILVFPARMEQIEVSERGDIRVNDQIIGRLRIVTFDNPDVLQRVDGSTFFTAQEEPQDIAAPTVRQGFIELSNVDPISEMVEMMTHARLFEAQQKLLQTTDQVLGRTVNELGKF